MIPGAEGLSAEFVCRVADGNGLAYKFRLPVSVSKDLQATSMTKWSRESRTLALRVEVAGFHAFDGARRK